MRIEAMKMALDALERASSYYDTYDAIDALKAALAEQAQPVAWAISYDEKTPHTLWPEGDGALLDLEVKRQGGTTCKMALYTSPPQLKPWVGLTEEEVDQITDDVIGFNSCGGPEEKLTRAIEAKLKEKNT